MGRRRRRILVEIPEGWSLKSPLAVENSKQVTSDITYTYGKITPENLLQFYVDLHNKKGLTTRRVSASYIQQVRDLIIELGPIDAVKAMIKAAKRCNTQFGFAYIRRVHYEDSDQLTTAGRITSDGWGK